ncbi:thioredoxin domain-containing protein [Streptomyces sp. NPDC059373]
MTKSNAPKAAKRRGGRWRPYVGTVVALAVVFGGSAVIGAHVRGKKESTVKVPTGAVATDQLGLPVKPTVPVALTVYEDLRSPASKAFAAQYATVFQKLLATGQVEIDYHLVTQSDTANGGRGALAAANAAACAQDQGRFEEYVAQVWAAQPADPQVDGLDRQNLLKDLAKKAKKIDAAKFVPCVQGRDHDGWVRKSQEAFTAAGFTAAPVLQINGATLADPTPAKLRAQVKQAVANAEAATTTTTTITTG